jgi:hypothetical protein
VAAPSWIAATVLSPIAVGLRSGNPTPCSASIWSDDAIDVGSSGIAISSCGSGDCPSAVNWVSDCVAGALLGDTGSDWTASGPTGEPPLLSCSTNAQAEKDWPG